MIDFFYLLILSATIGFFVSVGGIVYSFLKDDRTYWKAFTVTFLISTVLIGFSAYVIDSQENVTPIKLEQNSDFDSWYTEMNFEVDSIESLWTSENRDFDYLYGETRKIQNRFEQIEIPDNVTRYEEKEMEHVMKNFDKLLNNQMKMLKENRKDPLNMKAFEHRFHETQDLLMEVRRDLDGLGMIR